MAGIVAAFEALARRIPGTSACCLRHGAISDALAEELKRRNRPSVDTQR